MASKVSRKRNQGKARKAKAKAREEAEESRKNNIQTPDGQQQQSLEAQMQRLQIGVGKAQRDTTKCLHGFETMDDICGKFVIAFREAYYDAVKDGCKTASDCLVRAEAATLDGFAEVWNDSAKMQLAISFFLHLGAQQILQSDNQRARAYAIHARYLEQYVTVELHQTQATINLPKIEELTICADEHTLVKFFRSRIPCSCLDRKYEEVKHITKMGVCWNPQCSLLDRHQVERSKTMYCSRCRCVTYCSRGCQKADWAAQKRACDIIIP